MTRRCPSPPPLPSPPPPQKKIRQFKPKLVAIRDGSKVAQLKELIRGVSPQPEILVGDEGACAAASHPEADAVVTGIVGCAGLLPTVAAIKAKKDICLANKETLIAGWRGLGGSG